MLTYGLLGAISDQVGRRRAPRARRARARASRRPRSGRRRPRPGGRARRTTPGTGSSPAGVSSHVRSRSSVAGSSASSTPSARASRAVTAESGSPRRSASVRTRCRPMSRSPSRNQSSPPSSRYGLERVPRLVRPAPAALLVGEPGERVEDAVEVGRDVQAEHLDVVADVADDRHARPGRRPRRAPREEARAADAAGEHDDLHARGASDSSAARVRVAERGRRAARGPPACRRRRRGSGSPRARRRRAASARARGSARRCPARRAARTGRRGERERVRRPVGGLDERDAARAAARRAASSRSRGVAHGRSALTTSDRRRSSGRAPPRPPRPGRRPGRRPSSPSATTTAARSSSSTSSVAPDLEHAASTSRASPARAPALVGERREPALPSAPRKGTTTVGIVERLSSSARAPDNAAIAERLEAFAALLELAGAELYTSRAYRRAADLIRDDAGAGRRARAAGRVPASCAGSAPGIERRLRELVETGEIAELDELEREVLAGARRPRAPPRRIGRSGCSRSAARSASRRSTSSARRRGRPAAGGAGDRARDGARSCARRSTREHGRGRRAGSR